MLSPQDIRQHLITIIFSDEPTVRDLFSLVVAFAIIWFIVFSAVKTIVRPLIHNKKWLLDAMSKEYERHAKKQLEELNIEYGHDQG